MSAAAIAAIAAAVPAILAEARRLFDTYGGRGGDGEAFDRDLSVYLSHIKPLEEIREDLEFELVGPSTDRAPTETKP